MAALKWTIVALSLLNAGYMAFDGMRAITTGDYLRPRTGEYAGRLGPWSKVVRRVGIDPMSGLMKGIFLVLGLAGLVITIGYACDAAWGRTALVVFNICCLWNLIPGTFSSALQLVLLFLPRMLR